MKLFRLGIVASVLVALAAPGLALAGEGTDEFAAALSAYYAVSAEDVAAVMKTGIAPDEATVAILVAKLVKTTPVTIAELRARGDSWSGIMSVRHLSAESFYMIMDPKFESETYEPIFAKYREVKGWQWKDIVFTDEELVNLVNLKFVASHYDYSAFKVMALRDEGKSFVEICQAVKAAKEEMNKEQKAKKKSKTN